MDFNVLEDLENLVNSNAGESSEINEEENCLSFLPHIHQDIATPIFRCYLQRVAAIVSAVDLSQSQLPPLESPNELHQYSGSKLLYASQVLKALYQNVSTNDQHRAMYLGLVSEEASFVDLVILQSCRLMELDNGFTLSHDISEVLTQAWLLNLWQGPTLYFLGLITWSIETYGNIKILIEEHGLLICIIMSLKSIRSEVLQSLVPKSAFSGLIWLSVRILFQCVVDSENAQLLYEQNNCIDSLHYLLDASIMEIRLVTRAMFLCLPSVRDKGREISVLSDSELSEIVRVLNYEGPSGILSFHGLGCTEFVQLVMCLLKEPENGRLLMEWNIPDLLGNLSDKIEKVEEQEMIATLIWKLMQATIQESPDTEALTSTSSDQTSPFPSGVLSHKIVPAESSIELMDILMGFLCKTFLPYVNIPLEEGFQNLPEDTWFTAAVCIGLMSRTLFESGELITKELIYLASQKAHICQAMQLAFQISLTTDMEGSPKYIMITCLDDIIKILMAWSDGSKLLAKEIAKSGFLVLLTTILRAGELLGNHSNKVLSRLIHSLFTLLNISYDSSNYPAFFFAYTIKYLIPYLQAPQFIVSSNAKFVLSNLHSNLDCDQLLMLSLQDNEADYCVQVLQEAVNSGIFKAESMATQEILQILDNFTTPTYLVPLSRAFTAKKGKTTKLSVYDQKMEEVADVFVNNVILLVKRNIMSLLVTFLLHSKDFQSMACKLIWNILHHDEAKKELFDIFPDISDIIKAHPSLEESLKFCCLQLFATRDCDDINDKIKYATECFKLKSYFEVAVLCNEIIQHSDAEKSLVQEAKLLKGKALFYCYQQKIMYLMVNKSVMSKEEEKRLINECFECTKEVIYILGGALDELYIDAEGSRLLDWAMMDCVRETNQLNLCKRCLLCRRRDQALKRSHIFPKFELSRVEDYVMKKDNLSNAQKFFVFGLDKHQMKSAGDCWLWLCCKKCEAIMTQNGEDKFATYFPSQTIEPEALDLTIEYSSWLYNYCCIILFRTLSCVKFPRSFNDDEIFEAFLSCRRTLLALPVKGSTSDSKQLEVERFQNKLLSEAVTKDVEPYLFVYPKNAALGQDLIGVAFPWLASHRLVDGKNDLGGLCHFFTAFCNGINIVLRFAPSRHYSLPQACQILPQSGEYAIPTAEEAETLIPGGLDVLKYRSTYKYFKAMSEVLQQIAPRAAEKMVTGNAFQIKDKLDLEKQDNSSSSITGSKELQSHTIQKYTKPQLSMLPSGFVFVKQWPYNDVNIPQGHTIVLHSTDQSNGITVFLMMNEKNQPYAIYLYEGDYYVFLDGAYLTESDRELSFEKFLLDNLMCSQTRAQLAGLQDDVKTILFCLLSQYEFLSLEMFVHHYLLSVKVSKGLLSVGLKCLDEECWYCRNLCHCCLKPALLNVGDKEKNTYKFCSDGCIHRFRVHPLQMQKSTFAIDHRAEVSQGKFMGPSVLEIVNIYREIGETFNTFDLIGFYCGDDSGKIPKGEIYILWQVRKIDSQIHLNIRANENCQPLELIWCKFLEDEEAESVLESLTQKQSKLKALLDISMKALGCDAFSCYLENFIQK